jgi:hypothetical protein
MRNTLAEKLLVKIMEWAPEEIDSERPLLQALATFKLNDYQQFSPGIRFIESLVKWLQQFETIQEKKIAYKIVKDHLIFISGEQIAHLVSILYSEKINPILIKKTAEELKTPPYFVGKIANSNEYKSNVRSSLFIGLSDGSKIDQFRRTAGLNNEQVSATYDLSDDKYEDMLHELHSDIPGNKFKSLFLIDDFTASGRSYCRPEQGKGKILKFLNRIFDNKESSEGLQSIIDFEKLEIHILFYIATKRAIDKITEGINDWQEKKQLAFNFSVDCLQEIDEKVKEKILSDEEIMKVLKKYYDYDDASLMNRHYKEGKHDLPFLGFDECGLPIVLNHNTPNNSICLFWLPEDKKPFGLFPRISRHK